MRIYIKDKHALAYFDQQATPDFWDEHWELENLRAYILSQKSDKLFIPAVHSYLPIGSTLIEGGCGRGELVHALQYQGYHAIGIDFAEKTVQNIHKAVPELDIRVGDVRKLPLENDSVDGYISVGVIEHFWEGYFPILMEINRTVKPEGFLFISFPYMSPLRKLKLWIGGYPRAFSQQLEEQQDSFYQFALNWKRVVYDLEQFGFTLKDTISYDGIKGFKDELTWFQPWLQPIYDWTTHPRLRLSLNKLFTPFASHCMFLVMQKMNI